jgi:hypothetical protein
MKLPELKDVDFEKLFVDSSEAVMATDTFLVMAIIKWLKDKNNEAITKNDVINIAVTNSETLPGLFTLIPVILRVIEGNDEATAKIKMLSVMLPMKENSCKYPDENDESFITTEEAGEILLYLRERVGDYANGSIISICKQFQHVNSFDWKKMLMLYVTLWETKLNK